MAKGVLDKILIYKYTYMEYNISIFVTGGDGYELS